MNPLLRLLCSSSDFQDVRSALRCRQVRGFMSPWALKQTQSTVLLRGHKHPRTHDSKMSRRRWKYEACLYFWLLSVVPQEKTRALQTLTPPAVDWRTSRVGGGPPPARLSSAADLMETPKQTQLDKRIFLSNRRGRNLSFLTSSVVPIWLRSWFERTHQSHPEPAWAYSCSENSGCCWRCPRPCLRKREPSTLKESLVKCDSAWKIRTYVNDNLLFLQEVLKKYFDLNAKTILIVYFLWLANQARLLQTNKNRP